MRLAHSCIIIFSVTKLVECTRMLSITPVPLREKKILAAVIPGDPVVSGVFFQGISNAVGLYSNIILFRIALSWFPQLPRTFPILNPVFTVTEPYLRFFRKQIPSVGGFDISAIPAIFALDLMSQAAVALGADIPAVEDIL